MSSQVVGVDFTGGAQLPNYVNGRLLVAEDLATGQRSLRTRDTRVGEAAGAGVVRGLWVTGSQTTLTVAPGLAISASGEPVVVSRQVTLKLTTSVAGTPKSDADFGCCTSDTGGESSDLVQGILLLTARPSCRLDGQAPLVPPPSSQVSPCCAAQWLVEGVEFRAIVLPVGTDVAGEEVTAGNRRNLVAHWCLGTERLLELGEDPFGFDAAYRGLDQLDSADLTSYDVPLAVLQWDGAAVSDLDNWSARRRVTQPDPVPSSWSVTVSERRESDGIARFLQFQDQAEELVSRALAGSATANQYFGFLPPVGFLPVGNSDFRDLASTGVRELSEYERRPLNRTVEDAAVAAERRWRPQEYRRLEKDDLTGHIHALKQIVEVSDASAGYGFDPRRFFGTLGRVGGFLDWQLAEWALEQSWRALPESTSVREDLPDRDEKPSGISMATEYDAAAMWRSSYLTRAMSPAMAVDEAEPPPDAIEVEGDVAEADTSRVSGSSRRTPPYTYYYVVQNVLAAARSTSLYRSMDKRERRLLGGFSTSNLYVVFIANRTWIEPSRPPFAVVDTSSLVDSG